MAGVQRFEDLIAWQKARALNRDVYEATQNGAMAKDFGLRDQIRRAAVSIPSNVAEGFERRRPAEFHQFLSVAKASCAELRTQLYLALDVGYLNQAEFDRLKEQSEEVARLVAALRTSVERLRERDRHD